jgi:hypothetical protein
MDSSTQSLSGIAGEPSLTGGEGKQPPVPRRSGTGLTSRTFYRDHMLSCNSMRQEGGRYQARVAITTLSGQKTRAQRFLDLEVFASHEAAVERALQAGKAWVDTNG